MEFNKDIEKFLDYYCNLKHSPEYAVMLKGPWGCGKTWFIKKYLQKQKNIKYLYVSLYGLKTFDEIQKELFKQLHPKLSSQKTKFLTKLFSFSGIINSTDIDFTAFFINVDGYFLIFDDLERCNIDTSDLIGHINNFIEHKKNRVLIIANENEIKNENYKKIKEKVIGKIFEIESDFNEVFTNFLSTISNEDVKNFISLNKNIIIEIYNASNYKNFRHLKQSLWDFERFFAHFSDTIKHKNDLLQDIFKLFLVFSFEIRSGQIAAQDIKELANLYYKNLFRDDKESHENKSQIELIIKKYNINLYNTIIDTNSWINLFDKGIINFEEIEESIKKSHYFQNENTPNWVKLWHFRDLEDDEFLHLLELVESEYFNKNYKEIGQIKHITGIFLKLSAIDLYKKSKVEILKEAKDYIDFMKSNGLLNNESSYKSSYILDEWGGLGFIGKEIQEFREFETYLREKTKEAKISTMVQSANELLLIMKSNIEKFSNMITVSNSADRKYCSIPIFKYIDIDNFISNFLSLSVLQKKAVAYAIEQRYKFEIINKDLIDEKEWLKKVLLRFENEQIALKGKLSFYLFKDIIDCIKKSIERLEKENT